MKRIFFLLPAIITLIPFVIISCFFQAIPANIPAFMDLSGHSLLLMNKDLFSVFRIPWMGVMLQITCYTMFYGRYENGRHRELWRWIALSSALKMTLTSLEIIVFDNDPVFQWIRGIVFLLIMVTVAYICLKILLIYFENNKKFLNIFPPIQQWQKYLLVLSLTGYFILVFLPLLI